jgi:putative NADPH-quinone reductase
MPPNAVQAKRLREHRNMSHSTARRIVILQGHPDPAGGHLCHALAEAYASGAKDAGHSVEHIDIARLEFPVLRTKQAFETDPAPPGLGPAQAAIANANHLLIVYPLWLGGMPALLKAFMEQVFRPDFAFRYSANGFPRKLLKGKSARIIVTMGMPAIIYRWYFGAHSLKSLEQNILRFCGIGPIKETLCGMVEAANGKNPQNWLAQMRKHGAAAS